MYHFGMFITDRHLHPLPRALLEEAAPQLKARWNADGVACAVFVLTETEYPADVASVFGFPVNLVVSTDRTLAAGWLAEAVFDVLAMHSVEVHAMPYVGAKVWEDDSLMEWDTTARWRSFMTEANDLPGDAAETVAAHGELAE